VNLNGRWTFEFDPGRSGRDRGRERFRSRGFGHEIRVPFCPESALSGVGHTDFIEALWYHRKVHVPAEWAGRRVRLHFGAADYEAEVYVDGRSVGTHFGGSASFTFDITRQVKPGQEHDLVVRISDELRSGGQQPAGKQCWEYRSKGCHYTRVTGLWQTVWLEPVAEVGLDRVHIVPDLDGARFVVAPSFLAAARGVTWSAEVREGGRTVARAEGPAAPGAALALPLERPRAWSPADPHLYDLVFEVRNAAGQVVDRVQSYAGLRKVHLEGNRLFLNNEPLFLRLVLDQGFYPDGIWTAPSDAALRRDIELSRRAGFNGARLHQKVFEERFHYWADRLGYLTWGEFPSWGADVNSSPGARNLIAEWGEVVVRDRNHPSIIAWTPLNETGWFGNPGQHRRVHRDLYELSKALDPTRPVNDSSGYIHAKTDLWTVHNYEQNPEKLRDALAIKDGAVWRNYPEQEVDYEGQPYIVDEFGGIQWIPPDRRPHADDSWGYGNAPKSLEEFYARLEGQVDAIVGHPHIAGFCYTQLTDVEQEQNGIYNYDRAEKFDMARIAAAFRRGTAGPAKRE
jgi:beta-galactosidase/beta-glucuronidase